MLKIDDKDYSITFSLYFNVQWSEPRLNLSKTFFNSENITSDDHLVPGRRKYSHKSKKISLGDVSQARVLDIWDSGLLPSFENDESAASWA